MPASSANRAVILCALLAGCAARSGAPLSPGSQDEVAFTLYPPLAAGDEIARRALSPLTHDLLRRQLAATGKSLREEVVDLAQERFSVYVPAGAPPPGGYGLLVFVWPSAEPPRIRRWRLPLDRHGLVLVAARRSGNDAPILDRRLPLAVLAAENVRARLPIDPGRVYVGGFSGGGRVALIAALAFPDVFRGALLDAGSDRIDGERGIYLPPTELFRRFQRTRLVYATGAQDEDSLQSDDASRASMRDRCVLDVDVILPPRLGHEPLDAVALDRALDALDRRSPVDEAALERCNARLAREVSSALAGAEEAIRRGDRESALARLKAADARYGGLAAPAIVDLDARRRAMP
jgi:pimeloyl-ACP methyl ester carboxylesterase